MSINIEELKLILLYKSSGEIEAALRDFDIASFDSNGSNILHYYVNNHEIIPLPVENTVRLFLDFGININAKQSRVSKRTALHLAVLMKSKAIFDLLLANGADVNAKDRNGNMPLSDAVFCYRGDDGYFIESLIANGADVDIMNNYDVSPKLLAETIANYDTRKFFS